MKIGVEVLLRWEQLYDSKCTIIISHYSFAVLPGGNLVRMFSGALPFVNTDNYMQCDVKCVIRIIGKQCKAVSRRSH